jgi:hypothetical protein
MTDVIAACVFCSSKAPMESRDYGTPRIPKGVTWPTSHCFQGKSLAVCAECRGAFVRQPMQDEDISAFYSAIYDPRARRPPRVSDFHELNARFLSQALYLKTFLDLRDGTRILELGPNLVSALPALSLFCRPRYYYFDQVDSEIISRYGGKRLGPYASGAEIVRKCGREQLDLVYASHSLEHVNPSNLGELLEGAFTALAPGGHFFFEVPDDLSINLLLVPHTLFFTEASMRQLLARHGFEIVNLAHWGGMPTRAGVAQPDSDISVSPSNRVSPPGNLRAALRNLLLGIPFVERMVRPLRLQRGLMLAMKRLPTPYEPTPYFRVIARKGQAA